MRLLLRANAHRVTDGGVEVAASPDTPGREAWQWHVRVLDPRPAGTGQGPPGVDRQVASLPGPGGSGSVLEVSSAARVVTAKVEVVVAGEGVTLERDPDEIVLLVVGEGRARVEDRHLLGELDTLVLEGDDPFVIGLERAGVEPTSVGVVRLRAAGDRAIGWVP